jgi:putative nucleotidyltransferase with HDIG domain
MKPLVSRLRAKRTKDREKKAVKAPAIPTSWLDRWPTRLIVALLFWLLTALLMGADHLLLGHFGVIGSLHLAGKAALLLVCLFASSIGLNIIRPATIGRTANVMLLALIALAALVPVKLILYIASHTTILPHEVVPFLLPFAMAPLAATLLLQGAAGVAVGIWTALAICLFANAGIPVFLGGLVATVTAASLAHRARTRTRIIRAGVIAGFAQILCVVGITALNAPNVDEVTVIAQAAACIGSGFLAAVLALIILPPLERLFRISSDITLLELTDLGHPLLQRMALEAPGTYHHSLVVANLAQAAADEIGANSLLARVCAYFHDVGKIYKPGFFTENIRADRNPHDRLPPSMSTLVITSHVKEGVSMALLHKLPRPIIDVIQEHHGTTLVSYFHDKARAQLEFESALTGTTDDDRRDVADWTFRYTGPKPSFPESAIICLADPVEAASRSIEKVSPAHISDLVDGIVNTRLEDGQLDNSQLTLADLARIKKSFVFTLTNMLHARTPYPRDEDRDKQSSKAPSATPSEA